MFPPAAAENASSPPAVEQEFIRSQTDSVNTDIRVPIAMAVHTQTENDAHQSHFLSDNHFNCRVLRSFSPVQLPDASS